MVSCRRRRGVSLKPASKEDVLLTVFSTFSFE